MGLRDDGSSNGGRRPLDRCQLKHDYETSAPLVLFVAPCIGLLRHGVSRELEDLNVAIPDYPIGMHLTNSHAALMGSLRAVKVPDGLDEGRGAGWIFHAGSLTQEMRRMHCVTI